MENNTCLENSTHTEIYLALPYPSVNIKSYKNDNSNRAPSRRFSLIVCKFIDHKLLMINIRYSPKMFTIFLAFILRRIPTDQTKMKNNSSLSYISELCIACSMNPEF